MKKAKVRRIKNKTVQTDKLEINSNKHLSLSAELLKEIISLVFLLLVITLVIVSVAQMTKTVQTDMNCLCVCLLVFSSINILFMFIFIIVYNRTGKFKPALKVLLLISFFMFSISLTLKSLFSLPQIYDNTFNTISIIYFLSFFTEIFLLVYFDIMEEKDRSYIVNYFSALTSLAALIVALVALFK